MAERKSLVRKIRNLERRVNKIALFRQQVGADIVQIVATDEKTGNTGSVAAGGVGYVTFTVTPSDGIVTLWDFIHSIYVDTDNDSNYLYPTGASLSSGDLDLNSSWSIDLENSNDSNGVREAVVAIVNDDSSSHTYYIHAKFYGIKQGLS